MAYFLPKDIFQLRELKMKDTVINSINTSNVQAKQIWYHPLLKKQMTCRNS